MVRALPALALLAAVAHAAPRDYVGVKVCGDCHPAELAQWRGTAHATAADRTVLGRRVRDGRCLVCHGTGEGASPRALAPGVGCEACHGPGVAYAVADVMRDPPLARALGLRADPLATCARCHRGRTSAAGAEDAAAAWGRIAHRSPAATSGEP